MALYERTLAGDYATTEFGDDDLDATVEQAGSGAKTLHHVYVDCRENTSEDVTIRFWNTAAGSVTNGSTDAVLWFRCPKGIEQNIKIKFGGIAFGTALSCAAVKNVGGTGGSDSPSGTVKVKLKAS
jgi:hypothetical protein